MPITFGLRTKTHLFICSEANFGESIVKVKDNEKRTFQLGDVLINICGPQSGSMRVGSFASEYSKLMCTSYGMTATPGFVAGVIQDNIYEGLRSHPTNCSAVIGGLVKESRESGSKGVSGKSSGSSKGGSNTNTSTTATNSTDSALINNIELYSVDGYGALHKDNFVVTGYGLYFLYGLYDTYYSEDMSEAEALFFIQLCLKALKERLVLDTSNWYLDIMENTGLTKSNEIVV